MADLLVNDVDPRAQYTAAAAQTVFAYPFAIFEDSDLLVYLTPSGQDADDDTDILVLTTDYTVSDAGETAGGDVTLVVAADSGDIITIVRDVPVARTSDYQTAGDFLAETVNDDFDKLVMMVQQQEVDLAGRILRFLNTVNLTGISTDLPAPTADGFLKWNAAGTALENVPFSTIDPTAVIVSAFVETLLDDSTGDAFWATLYAAMTTDLPVINGTDVIIARASADTDVNNSTTAVVATGMSLTLEGGTYYAIEGYIELDQGAAAADLEIGLVVGSGASGQMQWQIDGPTTFMTARQLAFTSTINLIDLVTDVNGNLSISFKGTILTSPAGDAKIYFNQNAAVANDTSVKAGSWVQARKMA